MCFYCSGFAVARDLSRVPRQRKTGFESFRAINFLSSGDRKKKEEEGEIHGCPDAIFRVLEIRVDGLFLSMITSNWFS